MADKEEERNEWEDTLVPLDGLDLDGGKKENSDYDNGDLVPLEGWDKPKIDPEEYRKQKEERDRLLRENEKLEIKTKAIQDQNVLLEKSASKRKEAATPKAKPEPSTGGMGKSLIMALLVAFAIVSYKLYDKSINLKNRSSVATATIAQADNSASMKVQLEAEKSAREQSEAKPVSQKPFESFKHEITSENRPHKVKPLSKDITPEDYSAPPPGFQQKITKHFVLYEEGEVSAILEKRANEIHSNIMLDLAEFKPWEREKIVFIYYAHSASSYRKISDMPAWSGGAASLDTRSIFLYKSVNNSFGILAHELTHMYFDSFFPPKHPSPLWLSEGMAIYIQTERSNEKAPNWLKEYVDKVRKGSKYPFQVLTTVEDLDGTNEEDIRIWYAEAYLLTKYLMTVNGMKAFYSFCNYLKMGFTLEQAVKMAYRQDLKVVEENWRLKMQQDAASGK